MRRLLAALAALLLLVVGTAVLVAYVHGADNRALAGVRSVDVLVADELIPEGTPADEISRMVRTETVPAKSAVAGRVTDLDALTARFAQPDDLQSAGTVAVPAGLQEVSVLLEPQRAVGGRLAAGDTVGVVVSLTFEDGTSATHAVLHDVLVTQVQGAPAPVESTDEQETASSGSLAPLGSLMITFAVSAAQAEAVVFGVEHGTLWLSLEPEGAETGGTDIVTQGNIYGKAFA